MHGGRIKLVNRLAPRSLTARGVSPRPSPAPRPTLKLYSPQGNKKPGHHIRRIEDQTSSELVGQGWVGRATEGALGLAWLYDIEIVPARPRPRPRPCRHGPHWNRGQTLRLRPPRPSTSSRKTASLATSTNPAATLSPTTATPNRS